jgi:hypothetical protein
MTAATETLANAPLDARAKASLMAEIALAYGVARWALWRHGLRPALATLRGGLDREVRPGPARDRLIAGVRLGRAVSRMLRVLPVDSRCLISSLVLTRMLARRGIESELVISVRPGEKFAAHAWVEHGGLALLPADAPASELVRL